MSATTRKSPGKLAPDDVEYLGEHGGWSWARWDGHEYTMDPVAMASVDIASPIRPDEIRIHSPRERVNFGTVETWTAQIRGRRAPAGAYEAAIARDLEPAKLGPKPHRPVDLVRRLPALRGRPDTVLNGPERRDSKEMMRDITRVTHGVTPAGPTTGAYLAATPAATGPAAIVERLASKGAQLSITPGGRLLVTTPGGHLSDDLLGVVMRCERLLVGFLTGVAIRCELEHPKGKAPEAVTVLAVDVMACAEHAVGQPATTAA